MIMLLLRFVPWLVLAGIFLTGLKSCLGGAVAPQSPMMQQIPGVPQMPDPGAVPQKKDGLTLVDAPQTPAEMGHDAPNRPSAWQETIMSEQAVRTWQWGRGRLELKNLVAEPDKTVATFALFVTQDDVFLVDLLASRLQIGATSVGATSTTFPTFQKDWPLPVKGKVWTNMDVRDVKTRVLVGTTIEYEMTFPAIGSLPDISAVYLRAVHVDDARARFFLDKDGRVKDNPYRSPLEVISLRWSELLRKRLSTWEEPAESPAPVKPEQVKEIAPVHEVAER